MYIKNLWHRCVFFCLFIPAIVCGKELSFGYADLSPSDVVLKSQELLLYHPVYKTISPELCERILLTFCEELDPLKLYLLKDEITEYLSPSKETLERVQEAYSEGNFSFFEKLYGTMKKAIQRRAAFEEKLSKEILPKGVEIKSDEFEYVSTINELYERWVLLRAVQAQAASTLEPNLCETALLRIRKRRASFEEQRSIEQSSLRKKMLCTFLLKAFASALDSQTSYYTPSEAKQLLISMQQRLFGIGILMRDDADGFSVIKVVEGGPADRQKSLQLGDKIVAVNGEPVIGLDITEVVEMIRGDQGSIVSLKILRKEKETPSDQLIARELKMKRGEVVVKEMRYGSKIEPFEDGVLAYVRLHSFYQDEETSSYQDLYTVIEEIKEQNNAKGLILDLRSNPGGLLNQAVAVSGLFLDKGVVVSVKDDDGKLVHMRNFGMAKIWDGPLIVLINRASASSSEIVAQVLQDWGRAIIVGDDHSFGKGSFQLFSLNPDGATPPSPMGEYKVTRGRYYTVSGKSPQLIGVCSDVIVPGSLSFARIGEKFSRFPLPSDSISAHFTDSFEDIPYLQRGIIQSVYRKNRQCCLDKYVKVIPKLRKKSEERLKNNAEYAQFLERSKKLGEEVISAPDDQEKCDFQLSEGFEVLKDLLRETKK